MVELSPLFTTSFSSWCGGHTTLEVISGFQQSNKRNREAKLTNQRQNWYCLRSTNEHPINIRKKKKLVAAWQHLETASTLTNYLCLRTRESEETELAAVRHTFCSSPSLQTSEVTSTIEHNELREID